MKPLKIKGLKFLNGKYELYNQRFLFFPPQIIDLLSSIYGEGVNSLLVWLGKKAGWQLIQQLEENLKPRNLDELANEFITILNHFGWGKFKIKVLSEDSIVIELSHNISSQLENKSQYFCYFITGILTGFGEFALYQVNAEETKCSLKDSNLEFCEFTISKR
ncbi:MAG: hypothetical protein ACTSW3_03215 [Promethearchaeota archaeon]